MVKIIDKLVLEWYVGVKVMDKFVRNVDWYRLLIISVGILGLVLVNK